MSFLIKKIIKKLPTTNFDAITSLPEVVFFDYDGTICNNSKYLVKAFNYAVKLNFDKKKDKKTLSAIKKIKKDSEKWAYIKQNCPQQIFVKCNEDYDKYIAEQKICLVKNVKKVIKLLSKYDIPMYVISQKRGDGLREELKKAKLNKYFVKAYGTLDFGELQKPEQAYVDAVLNDSKSKTKSCWMIGDRCSDATTGINMNGFVFIIDKGEVEKIKTEYNQYIGKTIFFTSFNRLKSLLTMLRKNQNKTKK